MRTLVCLLQVVLSSLLLCLSSSCTVQAEASTTPTKRFRSPFSIPRKRSSSTSICSFASTSIGNSNSNSNINSISLSLRGGSAVADTAQLVEQAYGWATNLGAPAALVAGAVIATLYETLSSGSLDVNETTDPKWVQVAKKATRILLVSAFIMQTICIFCTTVLGTQLISDPPLASNAVTSVQYLQEHYEFEVLTIKLSFLQGLVTWLAAIAIEHAIPQDPNEPANRRNMDMLIASSLTTLIIAMLAFYNTHMNFYNNFLQMLHRYAIVVFQRYFAHWPPKPLTVLAIPSSIASIVYFFKVFLVHDGNASDAANNTKGSKGKSP
jgi:hypothetical protein